MKRVNLIFATTPHGLFGTDDELPWDVPADMKHFNRVTQGTFETNVVVMGRKTFESFRHPSKKLEGRINVVLSKTKTELEGADYVYTSFDNFLMDEDFPSYDNIFVIGGAELIEMVYVHYFHLIDKIYYSKILTNELKPFLFPIYMSPVILGALNALPYKMNAGKNVNFYLYELPKHEEYQYLDLLKKCLSIGDVRETRNATTYSIFNEQITFDLSKGFPLLTTKKVFMRGIFEELMFFLKGQTDSKLLEEKGVNIWKPNTTKEFIDKNNLGYEEGDMGPMYGFQWKHFNADYTDCKTDYTSKGLNQLEYVMQLLRDEPHSRRMLMTTYNPAQAKKGVLYPCHSIVIQFYCEDYKVSMTMYQRSVDLACGLPFNIASNALLLHIICHTLTRQTGILYTPDKLHITLGDIHIYSQHVESVKTQLKRIPYSFPWLAFKNVYPDLEDYKWEDIELLNYNSHPAIKFEMVA
jgi:dihydrofolate reductase/thymidylate synthase